MQAIVHNHSPSVIPFGVTDVTLGSSQALVRYETNDYSVPVEYGHRQVLLKAFVWEVVISCSSEVIARHPRSYDREEMIFNPLHYLALLEQKTNALDQAAPLQGWQLPEEFLELRRQMEARLGKRGRREYVQVLRLLETFSMAEVGAGVRQALRFPAISFDAVKHLVLCSIEQRPARLDLENYPHLPLAKVALTRAADYQQPWSANSDANAWRRSTRQRGQTADLFCGEFAGPDAEGGEKNRRTGAG